MDKIKKAAAEFNIEYIGSLPYNGEGFSSVVIALIPYYAGEADSYLSKYTRGKDYHQVGRRIMENILEKAGESEYKILIDVSPLDERNSALKAGLGVIGKNGLLINEKYGSYVFIATALIKRKITTAQVNIKECLNCGICVEKCPSGAINNEGIDYSVCISHLTQVNNISGDEEKLIASNGFAWGCDVCQDCCPMNKNAEITPFDAFKKDLLLKIDDINTLSQKEFKKKYKEYALAYKGRNIIRRNINLITERN